MVTSSAPTCPCLGFPCLQMATSKPAKQTPACFPFITRERKLGHLQNLIRQVVTTCHLGLYFCFISLEINVFPGVAER